MFTRKMVVSIDTYSRESEPGTVCAFVIQPWRLHVALGTLPPGSYTLLVVGAVNETASFTVAGEWLELYVPFIAKSG